MKKIKVDTSKGPDPKSKRSVRRAKRGFKSVELSTRKGRRAAKRLAVACNISGKQESPGTKTLTRAGVAQKQWLHTAGGSMRFH